MGMQTKSEIYCLGLNLLFRKCIIRQLNMCIKILFLLQTYGIIRVPLFTMGDGLRGFPAFLANQFAGHSRCELILGLLTAKLFTENEMAIALSSYRQYAESLRNKKLL